MLAIMGYFLLQVGPYGPFVYMQRIIRDTIVRQEMCRTAKSYRIARACSGPKIVLLMAGYALYSVSDRPLGNRPRLGSPRAQPGHDDQSASTKRSRASNRTNKHDRRGVLRYPGTMRIQPDCDDDSQPVIVPRNDKPLVAVKPDRAHRLREHLIKVIRELRTEKRWARSAQPAEPTGFPARVAQAACSLCKGFCCRNGDDDGYLDDRTLARVLAPRQT